MKNKTVNRWCEIFGTEIVDNDGFNHDLNKTEISLDEFFVGYCASTTQPTDRKKESVLFDLMY